MEKKKKKLLTSFILRCFGQIRLNFFLNVHFLCNNFFLHNDALCIKMMYHFESMYHFVACVFGRWCWIALSRRVKTKTPWKEQNAPQDTVKEKKTEDIYWNRSESVLCGLCEFLCVLCVKSFKRKGRKDSRKGRKELKNDQFVPVYGIGRLTVQNGSSVSATLPLVPPPPAYLNTGNKCSQTRLSSACMSPMFAVRTTTAFCSGSTMIN